MKRLLVILALLSSSAFAQDTWSGKDKIKHVQYSFVFGGGAALLFDETPWYAQLGIALIPGVIKEWHDHNIRDGSGWSWKDMGANLVGAAIGVGTGNLILSYNNGSTIVAYRTTINW